MACKEILAMVDQLEALGGSAELKALELCLAERIRQIVIEERSPAFDLAERQKGELSAAAAAYSAHVHQGSVSFKATQKQPSGPSRPLTCWPFPIVTWKPTSIRRSAEKAIALMLAELSRLIRAEIQ